MLDQMREEDKDIKPTRGEDGQPLAQLGDKDTSSTSSTVSNISSQASYEESTAGTVILGEPSGSNSESDVVQNTKTVLVAANQKDMLNSYQKTIAKAELAKI